MELVNVGDIVAESSFQVFKNALEAGDSQGINAVGAVIIPAKEIDDLTKYASIFGAKGLPGS